jgi:hypothetical protein
MHRQMMVALLAGVLGAARTHKRRFATRETCLGCHCGDVSIGRRARQESEGLIRPMTLGNSRRGKEPWFGVCSNDRRRGDWR